MWVPRHLTMWLWVLRNLGMWVYGYLGTRVSGRVPRAPLRAQGGVPYIAATTRCPFLVLHAGSCRPRHPHPPAPSRLRGLPYPAGPMQPPGQRGGRLLHMQSRLPEEGGGEGPHGHGDYTGGNTAIQRSAGQPVGRGPGRRRPHRRGPGRRGPVGSDPAVGWWPGVGRPAKQRNQGGDEATRWQL